MRWIQALAALACLTAGAMITTGRDLLAQGPPTRFFGAVSINGAPAAIGTTIEGFVDGQLCGDAAVRELEVPGGVGYVLDIRPDSLEPGCGQNDKTVTFKIGGLDAEQTGTFTAGSFVRLDLTASGQIATPGPSPTPLPIESPRPAATATPGPGGAPPAPPPAGSPPPGGSPTPPAGSPPPGASPTPDAAPSPGTTATVTGTPSASPTAGATADASASPTATVAAEASPGPARVSPDAARRDDDDGGVSPAVWALPLLALLGAVGAGAVLYRRRRSRGTDAR